jgi:hypothetical protein
LLLGHASPFESTTLIDPALTACRHADAREPTSQSTSGLSETRIERVCPAWKIPKQRACQGPPGTQLATGALWGRGELRDQPPQGRSRNAYTSPPLRSELSPGDPAPH